jgi:hypothetical protein
MVDGVGRCGLGQERAAHQLCPPQFPADIIRHAVWLYLRFTLSYRNVEEFLAERGPTTWSPAGHGAGRRALAARIDG